MPLTPATNKRVNYWSKILQAYDTSGSNQSIQAFCKAKGITDSAFYYWRRKLKATPSVIPSSASPFMEMTIPDNNTGCLDIELVLSNPPMLRFNDNIDIDLLGDILQTTRQSLC